MPIDKLLELLRSDMAPLDAWSRVLALCEATQPCELWRQLPPVDVEGDAERARAWLAESLRGVRGPVGLYLGLDTLNMQDGGGTNLELGWNVACDTASDDIDWVFERLERGPTTLIRGLADLRAEYSQARWRSAFGMADYILFLAYSGLVLAQALRRLERDDPMLAAWGLHDGDLFALCRSAPGTFQMICR